MNKLIAAFAGAACLLVSTASHATQYKLDFTVGSFTNDFVTLDRAPIAGSIMFTADTMGAAVQSIDAVDLTIDGHTYTADEIGGELWGTHYAFGGKENTVGGVNGMTNDFYIYMNGASNDFEFATDQSYLYFGRDIAATFSEVGAAADVPEPGSAPLMLAGLAGLGGLGLMRRRR
jgi:hypothetical protein